MQLIQVTPEELKKIINEVLETKLKNKANDALNIKSSALIVTN